MNAIMWLAYGLFNKDNCVALPNVGGVALGVVQMVLYAIYRNGGAKEQALEGVVKTIVVVNPLGLAEVFPIAVDDEKGLVDMVNNQQSLEKNKEEDAQGKNVEANDSPV
ncbi:unnamed protein product [Sphenostylis stenocarpa]|uniref:Uncharacterized protein n=1 Tax=Sphenostylis stenocarpa TaxID=92480 RepID=A0AA86SSR0_9FABA|nr:unnamed protein product [Sphenostylis stenocarpa]